MDATKVISRRRLLKAAPAVAVAAAVTPAIANQQDTSSPGDRLSDLMQEISEILDEALFGKFCAVIEPSKHDRAIVALKPIRDVREAFATRAFLKNADHPTLVEYHMTGVAKAMHAQHGGCWIARAERDHSISIAPTPSETDGVWVSFPIGD